MELSGEAELCDWEYGKEETVEDDGGLVRVCIRPRDEGDELIFDDVDEVSNIESVDRDELADEASFGVTAFRCGGLPCVEKSPFRSSSPSSSSSSKSNSSFIEFEPVAVKPIFLKC